MANAVMISKNLTPRMLLHYTKKTS